MNYKIVADSSSNVYYMEGVNYAFVPLKISNGNQEYLDIPETDAVLMAHALKNTTEKSHTSCPNIFDWQNSFSGADGIFAVTITSNLSGCYAAAVNAQKLYQSTNKNTKIHIIDSLSTGPEMQLLLEKLQLLVQKDLPFEEIVAQIDAYKNNTHLFFCLESLTNLASNGRISPTVAHLAGLFGIRLVGKASSSGTLEPLSKPRGEKKALSALYQHMLDAGFSGGKVRIAHCDNLAFARALKDKILANFPGTDIAITPCGALCAFYAELGGILIGMEGSAKK